jgi:hypothetical protein
MRTVTGGAIDIADSGFTGTLSKSTFSSVTAGNNGGAIDNGGGTGTPTVTESLFYNDSGSHGGAIANSIATRTGVLSVTASTFSHDIASTAGGEIDSGDQLNETGSDTGTAVVTGSTFAHTSATVSDASIAQDDRGGSGTTSLASDIITDVSSGSECSPTGIVDAGYNISDDGTCNLTPDNGSIGQSSTIDDYLGSLSPNGGPTETIHLLAHGTNGVTSGDPAAGVIPVGFTMPGTTTPYCSLADQRGFGRESDECDIGAYDAWSTNSLTASAGQSPTWRVSPAASRRERLAEGSTSGSARRAAR